MKKLVFLLLLCGLVMTSCSPRMIYLKDMRPELLYTLSQKPELKIQPQDRLRIVVSSKNPELVVPFNSGTRGYQMGSDGEIRMTDPSLQESGYLVDRQGSIEFPVLGMIRVEGLTMKELSDLIKKNLIDNRIVSDAIVTVDILNFKITLVGEVGGVGVQIINDDKITLLDAIIRGGGVTPNASMKEVVVIREDKRGYRMFVNDLSTVAVFDAPAFYLQQNDIVYVKPKTGAMSQGESRTWQLFGALTGLINTTLSLLILLNYYNK